MNKLHTPSMILMALFLVVSCSPVTSLSLATPTPTTMLPTQTSVPVLLITPTNAVLPTPTATETPLISQEITSACVDLSNANSDLLMSGVAVFDNLYPNLTKTIFLRNLENSTLRTLVPPGELWRMYGISPDRKHLLYKYEKPRGDDSDFPLVIADSLGRPVKEFDGTLPNDRWEASYFNWQNNEDIRVVLFFESQEGSRMSPRIYNPFTEDYTTLKVDFPNYVAKDLDWGLDWFALRTAHLQGANIVYDPFLARVMYPKTGEIVSLAEVQTGEELASVHLPKWGRLPKWTPDGEYLAIIGASNTDSSKAGEEIFVVHRDGDEFNRMTYFANTFEQSAIADYSWSPDGKRIAFWSYTDTNDPKAEGTQSELMILNIETKEVISLCIEGISAITHLNDVVLFVHLEPIWSPDGNQIMISQWAEPEAQDNKNYNVYVLDLPSLTVVKIDENKQPAGWMLAP